MSRDQRRTAGRWATGPPARTRGDGWGSWLHLPRAPAAGGTQTAMGVWEAHPMQAALAIASRSNGNDQAGLVALPWHGLKHLRGESKTERFNLKKIFDRLNSVSLLLNPEASGAAQPCAPPAASYPGPSAQGPAGPGRAHRLPCPTAACSSERTGEGPETRRKRGKGPAAQLGGGALLPRSRAGALPLTPWAARGLQWQRRSWGLSA